MIVDLDMGESGDIDQSNGLSVNVFSQRYVLEAIQAVGTSILILLFPNNYLGNSII